MATTTQVICDACGRAKMGDTGKEVEQLNLEVTGGMSVKLDVHNTRKCILNAVRTAVDKHFNVNGVSAS